MRKSFLFLLTAVTLYSCFLTKSPREREREEKEKYDNPMIRDQQAAEMIKDPALGYVPYNRLLAVLHQPINGR